jgi:glycyl-tRNA synthetase beta chain
MPELLLELFSEEIPARMQVKAADDLLALVLGKLAKEGLAIDAKQAAPFSTPRRIGFVLREVPAEQADVREEKKGPRVGSPDKAIEGFLKGAGLASLDQCEKRDTGKGEFWFAIVERKGRATAEVLPDLLAAAVNELPWPKSMRWGANSVRWVRPLHSILCLFGGKVVPFAFGPVSSGNTTEGHRFLGKSRFAVNDFADYRARLKDAHVLLGRDERIAVIRAGLTKLASDNNLQPVEDAGLMEEVAGLVEWPVPLLGRIDDAFMDVPREVLTTSMRVNQKYFTFNKADGSMAPYFGVIANMIADDGGARIVAGNEKVLRARLSDARFFWDQDRKARLDSRIDALQGIVFHAKLGSVHDKIGRVARLARTLANLVPGADANLCERAALLAKADLTSGMVGEFPELQGIMGRYYARNDGESAAVAEAIAEHYSPLGPNDRVPSAPVSVAVALADKIDTLTGFFAIDEKPTGSKDPFALRRAALGIIRIVLENRLRLPLRSLGIDGDLLAFFADRLRVYLRDQGARHDLVSAVFAKGDDDLFRIVRRVEALGAFLATGDGRNLLAAYKRAANILRIEEKKDGRAFAGAVDTVLLRAAEEQALVQRLDESAASAAQALSREDYGATGQAMAALRAPVDAFFDKVTVNAPEADLRENRLNILARLKGELDQLADFSQIEG